MLTCLSGTLHINRGLSFSQFPRMPSSADWLTFGSQCTARLGSFRTCLRLIIEPRSHLLPAHPGQFPNELARPYSLWGTSGLQAHKPTIFHGIQARGRIPASHSFPLPPFLRSNFPTFCVPTLPKGAYNVFQAQRCWWGDGCAVGVLLLISSQPS